MLFSCSLSVTIKLTTFHKSFLSIYNSSVIIISTYFANFLHLKKDLIYQFANLRHSCPQGRVVLAVQVMWGMWSSLAASVHWSSWVDSPGPITHPGDSSGSITCKLQLAPSVHVVQQDILFFSLHEVKGRLDFEAMQKLVRGPGYCFHKSEAVTHSAFFLSHWPHITEKVAR